MGNNYFMKEMISKKRIYRAIEQAMSARTSLDHYVNFPELEHSFLFKEETIRNLKKRLKNLECFRPKTTYAFFIPKNDLVYRRMIYVPFEDLVIRYMAIELIGEKLDSKLYQNCFANRLAPKKERQYHLLENYATHSWPKFCQWQESMAKRHKVLLRTDIASFYDSISHDRLLDILSKELDLPTESGFLYFFRKLLEIPIVSYSSLDGHLENSVKDQGLPIGSSAEGIIANIYLKSVDESMKSIEGIEYGRYNDDIRIFGNDRKSVIKAMMVLQEKLLSMGLNLGTGKTKIAVTKEEVNKMRSSLLSVSGMNFERHKSYEVKNLKKHLDLDFGKVNPDFDPKAEIKSNEDAKNFCIHLSNTKSKRRERLSKRSVEDIEKLTKIILEHPGNGKHASWLLVESIIYKSVRKSVRKKARKAFFALLDNSEVSSYIRCRLLHHILHSYHPERIDYFKKGDLMEIFPSLLSEWAFESNMTAINLMRRLGFPHKKIVKKVEKYLSEPESDPIRAILKTIRALEKSEKSFSLIGTID